MGDQPAARPLPTQDSTTQRTNIHALSEIQTRDPCIQAAKTHALDRAATTPVPINNNIGRNSSITLLHTVLRNEERETK
jgi:hypothetical protein